MMVSSVEQFESARRLLEGIAYRMLGTLADAQDVVQETYLRWMTARHDEIREPKSWLVTVCTRLATDTLQSARVRREAYVGTWLPEPLVVSDARADEPVELDESVSLALLVALETLSPLERAAFLLHDVFDYEFDEVAQILGRSAAACRKLASRARVSVRTGRPKFATDPESQRRVVSSFVQALRAGDVAGIARLLADDATLHADGGGKVRATGPLRGARAIAALFGYIFRLFARNEISFEVEARRFNGSLGIVIRENGVLATALGVEVTSGLIAGIQAQRNPEKLARSFPRKALIAEAPAPPRGFH